MRRDEASPTFPNPESQDLLVATSVRRDPLVPRKNLGCLDPTHLDGVFTGPKDPSTNQED